MYMPKEHYMKIGSINTRFFAEGKGSPVILIHGLGGSASGWLLSIEDIASHHRVYAMDLIGHGRTSPPPSGVLRTADLATFVIDFMAELKIDRAHIVGHSMGGAIALKIAIDFPNRVDKFILVDSGGLGQEISIFYRLMSVPLIGEWLALKDYQTDVKKYGEGLRASYENASFITNELVEELYRVERNPEHVKMLIKSLRLGMNVKGQRKSVYAPFLSKLPTIHNPTLVIWGREDAIVPLSHGESAVKHLPNARLEIIEKCGHVPLFEQPKIFNRLILEFLKK